MALPLASPSGMTRKASDDSQDLEYKEEIRKVFALFSGSGSEYLSLSELSTAMQKVSRAEPTRGQVEDLMTALDTDKDGRVSLADFTTRLLTHLKCQQTISTVPWTLSAPRASADESGSTRPSLLHSSTHTPEETTAARRRWIHAEISNFVLGFVTSFRIVDVRSKEIASRMETTKTSTQMADSKKKEESLRRCKRMCEKSLSEVCVSLHKSVPANNVELSAKCVQFLADVLSILKLFSSPRERLTIGEFLARLFRQIRDSKVSPTIIKFLRETEAPKLQFQACRYVCYYCNGPRIPNTPQSSSLHPSNGFHKSVCIRNGVGALLEKIINDDSVATPLRARAIEALGCIAMYDRKARKYVIGMGLVPTIVNLIVADLSTTLLKSLTWTLSILLGSTHTETIEFEPAMVKRVLKRLGPLLLALVETFKKHTSKLREMKAKGLSEAEDSPIRDAKHKSELQQVLANTLCCFTFLLRDGHTEVPVFWKQFVDLVNFPDRSIQKMALDTLYDILVADASHCEPIVKLGLLKKAESALDSTDASLKIKALAVISVVAQSGGFIEALKRGSLIDTMLQLLRDDDLCRLKIVHILRQSTRDATVTFSLVRDHGLVQRLGAALSSFRKYDPVLADIYDHVDPTYNFEFMEDCIETLMNVLRSGAKTDGGNDYIGSFDMELLESMSSDIMKLSRARGIDSWRRTSTDKIAIERKVVALLRKIQDTHLDSKTRICKQIGQFVDDLISNFRKSLESNPSAKWGVSEWSSSGVFDPRMSFSEWTGSAHSAIEIKATFRGETRTIPSVSRLITFPELEGRLSRMVGSRIGIYAVLGFGHRQLIANNVDLERAVAGCKWDTLVLELQSARSGSVEFGLGSGWGWGSRRASASDTSMAGDCRGSPRLSSVNLFSDNAVINDFALHSGLPVARVRPLWEAFSAKAKGGCIDRDAFRQVLSEVAGVKDVARIEMLFNAFDRDKSGLLDFRQVCTGLAILAKGSEEDKMQLAFQSFDVDNDGRICVAELTKIFRSILLTKGVHFTEEKIKEWVTDCFEKYDAFGKGYLTFDEFKKMAYRRKMLVDAFFGFE